MAEVHIEHVMKIYPGDVLAVNDANIDIRDGEFIVLVGPSGCGKSTTLRMVAGLEEISGGTVSIDSRVVNDVLPKDRDIAMVFQDYALYPHMDVYHNMAFGLRLRKFDRNEIDQRVREAAKVLGLEPYLYRKPKELSGGQRQRVAVGRAIVRHPKVYLFDEPLSNLDAKLRVEMRAELKRLHRQLKTTTVYVTHDQEEAMTLGDRIVVMKDGVIQQIGTPLEVFWTPANRFVAGFVGTPPMNFFNGKLESKNGAIYFTNTTMNLRLDQQDASVVEKYAGHEVIIGIRPEALNLSNDGRFSGTDNCIDAVLNVIEPLGEQMDLHITIGDQPCVARVAAQQGVEDNSKIKLYVDATRMHIFETGDNGVNLLLQKKAESPKIPAV